MDKKKTWGRFRFSIIGSLFAKPPDKGELCLQLEELASKTYLHPFQCHDRIISAQCAIIPTLKGDWQLTMPMLKLDNTKKMRNLINNKHWENF